MLGYSNSVAGGNNPKAESITYDGKIGEVENCIYSRKLQLIDS
jgi:hypothetical protein